MQSSAPTMAPRTEQGDPPRSLVGHNKKGQALNTSARVRLRAAASASALCTLLFVAAVGCTAKPDFGTLPKVSVQHSLGESTRSEVTPVPAKEKAASAEEPLAKEKEAPFSDPPDPPATYSKDYAEYTVVFDKGELTTTQVRKVHFAAPTPAPRRIGRFALELWLGAQLVERVRFDLPLLGATAEGAQDDLEKGLTTQAKVQIPVVDRATRAFLLDRKTRKRVQLTWPPTFGEGEDGAAADPGKEPASAEEPALASDLPAQGAEDPPQKPAPPASSASH